MIKIDKTPGKPALALVIAVLFAFSALSCASGKSNEALAHYKLGLSHLNMENIQLAYIEFQKSVQLDSGNKEVYNALGNVHLKLSEYAKAEQAFKKAAKTDPRYSEAYNNLCYVNIKIGEWDKAVKYCKKAVENTMYLTPEKAYYNLGIAYLRLGKLDESIASFNNAIKRFKGLYPAYYGLALSYNEQRKYGEAAEAMKTAIEFDPRFKGDRIKAENTFRTENPSDAIERKERRDYIEILKY